MSAAIQAASKPSPSSAPAKGKETGPQGKPTSLPTPPQDKSPAEAKVEQPRQLAGGPVGNVGEISDVDLKLLAAAVKNEQKRREMAKRAELPQPGESYKIKAGSLRGKTGTVVQANKTRVFLQLPGVAAQKYVRISDLEKVTA